MIDCLRLAMWSGPRNISTAIMYSFRQREDTIVLDEPLYGHYLVRTGLRHPGRGEVVDSLVCDGERVVREVLLGDCPRPVMFSKNMAHHLVGLDLGFLDELTNVLLTRDPREMLPSLVKNVPDADLDATGLPRQVAILERIDAAGDEPVVLDAGALLRDPRGVLTELCRRVGLTFEEAMLSWPAGAKPEDGVWAPYWYANVHASTGFGSHRPRAGPFPEPLEPLLDACLPLYERLLGHAIRPTEG